jgi:hypothetical protein
MQIRDINKPVNSKTLNETMAKKYGTKINVESFTLEQLQDARNKLRTKLSDIETNESFSGLSQNKTYSKNKLFLDVLNAAISERSNIDEGEIPAGLKAYQDKQKGKEDKEKKLKDKEKTPKDEKMPMDDNGTPNDKSDDKPAFLKKKKTNEGMTEKAVCKDCGDEFGTATTDCKNDCNDPTLSCWVKESEYKKMNEGEEKKMPLKAEVMKCCKNGMTEKEICEKYKGCNQEKMKLMASSCMKEYKKMDESKHLDEGKDIINNYFTKLIEGEEDKAEIVMAAKDMVDRLTGWMEDTAEMQSESMLELADAIRDEMGASQSEAFTNAVKPALESLYTAMEGTRVSLTQGVGMLTGEAEPMDAMGDEPALDAEEPGMEPTVDAEAPADDFAAAEAAIGGDDEAGRAKRESIQRSRRLGTILSSRN